jgi:outer membrane immunogenic protein
MKAAIGSTLALGLLSSSVMATELGPWAPTTFKDAPLPDFVPPFSWTGIYLGVQGGYAWGGLNFDDGSGLTVSWPQHKGWFAGGYAGFNLQLNPFVFGVEGDADGGNRDGATHVGGGYSARTDIDALASVRGRAGLAADRLLFFATGGWAWADVSSTWGAPNLSRSTVDTTLDGWTMGGGLDYAFATMPLGIRTSRQPRRVWRSSFSGAYWVRQGLVITRALLHPSKSLL